MTGVYMTLTQRRVSLAERTEAQTLATTRCSVRFYDPFLLLNKPSLLFTQLLVSCEGSILVTQQGTR